MLTIIKIYAAYDRNEEIFFVTFLKENGRRARGSWLRVNAALYATGNEKEREILWLRYLRNSGT